jgi:hypothetical protein
MPNLARTGFFFFCLAIIYFGTASSHALKLQSRYENIESEWGGHLKFMGEMSRPDDESLFQLVGTDTYYDAKANLRVKNKTFFSEWGYIDTHYELVFLGGDTWEKTKELRLFYPNQADKLFITDSTLNDDRRLFDLTGTLSENNDYILYHRLDRLSLNLQFRLGSLHLGRQALTWGNGLLFNPMDLFNPFAPTDIDRDYKVGDDMAVIQFNVDRIGELQFLYVPRKNTESHDVTWDQSSLAAKLHVAKGITEFDIMAAKHYDDEVIGLGSTGYLWNAAWRLDATYTFLAESSNKEGFFSLVANMDYSWVWWGKNLYGLIEFYFNDLGTDQYPEALTDPNISDRISRGEIFTLGKAYLSGEIQVEIHPLINVYLTLINNMDGPSGLILPRAIWDIKDNIQFTIGGDFSYGRQGTEFGGFRISQSEFLNKPVDNVFFWMTYFF